MNKEIIQEYINMVYDNYDTSILNFPTVVDIFTFMFQKIVKELKEKPQHTLVLVRNRILLDQVFNDFYVFMGENNNMNRINYFFEFDNGSMVFFKIFNRVEHPIFSHSNNILLFNVDFHKNNYPTLEMIDRMKRFNKKLFINCNIRDNVERVILRRYKEDNIFQNNYRYNISSMAMDLRRIKLEKIKEKCNQEI